MICVPVTFVSAPPPRAAPQTAAPPAPRCSRGVSSSAPPSSCNPLDGGRKAGLITEGVSLVNPAQLRDLVTSRKTKPALSEGNLGGYPGFGLVRVVILHTETC